MTDLVERLIELAHFERDMPRFTDAKVRNTASEARATISALQAEVDDVRTCAAEVRRHLKAEGCAYREDEFDAPYVVNLRAEAAEARIKQLEAALQQAREALGPWARACINDNGDISVNLNRGRGHEDYCGAYLASKKIDAALRSREGEK